MSAPRILGLIPARAGSKGVPGKNIRPLAGVPLIVHSIRLGKLCPCITRLIVSTDSQEIAKVCRDAGGDVPFLRPSDLAQDQTPMWPVVRHALSEVEREEGRTYDFLLLLDPTSPCRLPADISGALGKLSAEAQADGIIGVSRPDFHPVWHCVTERNGWLVDFSEAGKNYNRRQDLPAIFRINASLYLWRTRFVRKEAEGWRLGKHLLFEIPESRAIHIDEESDFKKADLLIRHGFINLPWIH